MTDESSNDKAMPLIEHLVALRRCLLKSVLALLLVSLAFLPLAPELHTLLVRPLLAALPAGTAMVATGAIAPFLAPFRLSLVAALLVCLPYILYQLWAFAAPGLYRDEKRLYGTVLVASILLFYAGMTFVYVAIFPILFHFMAGIALPGVTYMPDISNNLSVMLSLMLAFGAVFEVPVITFVMIRTGVTTAARLAAARRYVIVICFAVAAVLTPPDVLSQCLMAVPMWLLFEAGLLCGRLLVRETPVRTDPAG